eukprot:UN23479
MQEKSRAPSKLAEHKVTVSLSNFTGIGLLINFGRPKYYTFPRHP